MNSLISKYKHIALAVFSAISMMIPIQANAASTITNSIGVSDESLFFILTLVAIFQIIVILVIAGAIKSITSNRQIWQMRWKNSASVILTGALLLSGSQLMAEDGSFDQLIVMNDTGLMALIAMNLVLFATFIYLTSKLNMLMKMLMKDASSKVPTSIFDKISRMMNDSVPLEKEASVEMEHEYDGIRELDNNLPPWWVWGFYFCIAFAVVYMVHYHITGDGALQVEEYTTEMKEAEEAKAAFVATQTNAVDEANVELLTDATALGAGAKIFKLNCSPCHGETGGSMPGGVGPNLTDDNWIHGGSMNDIFKTIKYGVPEKGMVSWEAQLSPSKIQEVASYIKSLHGSNPANAKEPQGEIWVDNSAAASTTGSELKPLTDVASLEAGAKIYKLNCSPCHGQTAGSMPGGVGPNLTDEYWIHGGSMNDIEKVITDGVPEKGMVSWKAQLNPSKIHEVASYIKSLQGSNPENPKEPQGEIWTAESAE